MTESETVELPSEGQPPTAPRKRSGFWREVSGALAVGLSVLAVVVLGFQVVAWVRDTPGPGAFTVAGHLVVAGVAVLVQWFADRRRDWAGAVATVGVFLLAVMALWIFWWA